MGRLALSAGVAADVGAAADLLEADRVVHAAIDHAGLDGSFVAMYQVIETFQRHGGGEGTVNLSVDTASPVPPYEQIRSQLQAMVDGGALAEGTRLPPIRQLAGDLGLAANTVARAYRELELDGLVQARGRHGTIVTGRAAMSTTQRREVVASAAETFAREAQHHGMGLDDALAAVRRAFGGGTDIGLPQGGAS